ncbi:GTPase Era, mitochondrial [Electrophorus electricus]|uniref:GTPase Era, mitochondrial n=1 Tax=Electrophorus electricus TaxID=8005 RepID=A0A4W4HP17_ELEEL|nr:GTPase Era, mitochondrial [Electrophorus electricus]
MKMALRMCESILRRSLRFPSLSVTLENASPRLRTVLHAGGVVGRGLHASSAAWVSSRELLDGLLKGRALLPDGAPGHCPAALPPDRVDQFSLLLKEPDQPESPKCLKVAIIGAPNAGKSTLTNQLLGRKVFPVSKKVHTTRSSALGVITDDDTQIILLDTPGLTTPSKVKRHQLERSLLVDPLKSLKEADLVVVMVDVSDRWTHNRLDFEVLKCLALCPHIPAMLVLNKVDLLKNKTLLLDLTTKLTEGVVNGKRVHGTPRPSQKEVAEFPAAAEPQTKSTLSREQLRALKDCKGWPHFRDVFMLSATDGEDVEPLRRYLLVSAKPGPWQYHSEVLTDQNPEDVCTNMVREKLLEYLPQEVPYTVTQHIELWRETEDGMLEICIKLHVKKDSHKKMAIGPGGMLVTRLAREVSEDLMNAFQREVRLRISISLKR